MGLLAMCAPAWAQTKPLQELPGDLVHWSTMPMAVPNTIRQVGVEEGPISAMVWGPTKGSAVLLRSASEELWALVKPDPAPEHGPRPKRPVGMILSYEF